jgi:hypothetical protein
MGASFSSALAPPLSVPLVPNDSWLAGRNRFGFPNCPPSLITAARPIVDNTSEEERHEEDRQVIDTIEGSIAYFGAKRAKQVFAELTKRPRDKPKGRPPNLEHDVELPKLLDRKIEMMRANGATDREVKSATRLLAIELHDTKSKFYSSSIAATEKRIRRAAKLQKLAAKKLRKHSHV